MRWFIHLSPRKAEAHGGFGVKSLWSLWGCVGLLRVCFSCRSCNQDVASRFTTCFCLVKASSWLTTGAPRNIYLLSVPSGCSYFSRHCQRGFSSLQHDDTNTWMATLKERLKINNCGFCILIYVHCKTGWTVVHCCCFNWMWLLKSRSFWHFVTWCSGMLYFSESVWRSTFHRHLYCSSISIRISLWTVLIKTYL